jgi:hypothetical protein
LNQKTALFRFHDSLNDFLPKVQRQAYSECEFNGRQSVKHLIESLGVPHIEVGRINVDGQARSFKYLVQDKERVDVHPLNGSEILKRSGEPPRFVLDNHLGTLARYLRMLGFDCLYRNDFQDDGLAEISATQDRVLLTRDVRLLMRSRVELGYWLRSKQPRSQVVEVVDRYRLKAHVAPFRHCMRCNGVLQEVDKSTILDRLEPLTKRHYNDFRMCPDCKQIYWAGSHYQRMQNFIRQILDAR